METEASLKTQLLDKDEEKFDSIFIGGDLTPEISQDLQTTLQNASPGKMQAAWAFINEFIAHKIAGYPEYNYFPKQEFKTPYEAFAQLAEENLNADTTQFSATERAEIPKLALAILVNYLPKVTLALGVGVLANLYYWPTGADGAELVGERTQVDSDTFYSVLGNLMSVVGMSMNVAFNVYALLKILKARYANTDAAQYLQNYKNPAGVKKQMVNLVLTAGSSVTNLALSLAGGFNPPLAMVITAAGFIGAYYGNAQLPLPRTRSVNEKIQKQYIDSISAGQDAVLSQDNLQSMVDMIRGFKNPSLEAIDRLLPIMEAASQNMTAKEGAFKSKVLPVVSEVITQTVAVGSLIGYVEVGRVGFPKLIHGDNPPVLSKYLLGLPAAILSLLPLLGTTVESAHEIGSNAFSKQKTLGDAVLGSPKINNALNVIIGAISILSGGTGVLLNYNYSRIPQLSPEANELIASISASDGMVGAAITNAYYSKKLIEEIIIFFAENFGSPELKEVIAFIQATNKIKDNVARMNPDVFREDVFDKIVENHPYSNGLQGIKGQAEKVTPPISSKIASAASGVTSKVYALGSCFSSFFKRTPEQKPDVDASQPLLDSKQEASYGSTVVAENPPLSTLGN